MLATYVPSLHNSNQEIRTAGSSGRLQLLLFSFFSSPLFNFVSGLSPFVWIIWCCFRALFDPSSLRAVFFFFYFIRVLTNDRDLNSNRISVIEPGAFNGLVKLIGL